MRVYSPSQTKNFLTCPFLWLLSKRGWVPRTYKKADLYAMRGAAVSTGLEYFVKGKPLDEVRSVVLRTIEEEWDKKKIHKREYAEFKSVPMEQHEVANQALMLVQAYVNSPCSSYEVVHSEYTFKNHGWARADVIGKLIPSGQLLPIDFKAKDVPTQQFYMHMTKQDFRNDHQLLHYRWALNEEFGIEGLDYGIVILWFDKRCKVEYVPFTIHPERMRLWLESAKQIWQQMEDMENGKIKPYENASHKTQYGYCDFGNACLTHNRHEESMLKDYFNTKRG